MNKRNVFLVLGLALVLGLVITGCPSAASTSTGEIFELKAPGNAKLTQSSLKVDTATTTVAPIFVTQKVDSVPRRVVLSWTAPAQGDKQILYAVWIKDRATKKEYMVTQATLYGQVKLTATAVPAAGDGINIPTNTIVYSAEDGMEAAAPANVGAASTQTYYNFDDDKWNVKLDMVELFKALDTYLDQLATVNGGTYAPTGTATYELGIQAYVPYEQDADYPRNFVNPSTVKYITDSKSRITRTF